MKKQAIKVIGSVALAGFLALAVVGCGGTSDGGDASASSETTDESVSAEEVQAEYDVTIDGCTKDVDYEGNPVVVIDFTFTNNSEETTSMSEAVYPQVFQDGVECEMGISDTVDTSAYMSDVKPGASIPVKLVYNISSDSDVEVDVSGLLDTEEGTIAQQTYSLQ